MVQSTLLRYAFIALAHYCLIQIISQAHDSPTPSTLISEQPRKHDIPFAIEIRNHESNLEAEVN